MVLMCVNSKIMLFVSVVCYLLSCQLNIPLILQNFISLSCDLNCCLSMHDDMTCTNCTA